MIRVAAQSREHRYRRRAGASRNGEQLLTRVVNKATQPTDTFKDAIDAAAKAASR
ncbi:hypothetical protein [Streptomyces sp. NBC_00046]|uniref:hypothetical protein n=1 Tax=unclassified Streptomyces TaxID=2593676 RepID=UPI003254D494